MVARILLILLHLAAVAPMEMFSHDAQVVLRDDDDTVPPDDVGQLSYMAGVRREYTAEEENTWRTCLAVYGMEYEKLLFGTPDLSPDQPYFNVSPSMDFEFVRPRGQVTSHRNRY
jgi:hypothetical protein